MLWPGILTWMCPQTSNASSMRWKADAGKKLTLRTMLFCFRARVLTPLVQQNCIKSGGPSRKHGGLPVKPTLAGTKTPRLRRGSAWLTATRNGLCGRNRSRLLYTDLSQRNCRGRPAHHAYAKRTCGSSPEAVFRFVQLLVDQKRFADAIPVAENAMKADPHNEQFGRLLNQLKSMK